MPKIVIILLAYPGTHDAMGRTAHAFLYTKDLKEAGVISGVCQFCIGAFGGDV